MSAAFRRLEPGDQLCVWGGDYLEDVDVPLNGGTAEAGIVVRAAPGERPVLHGLLRLHKPDFWTVRGLNVTWRRGLRPRDHLVKVVGGAHWQFVEAEVWNARSFAAVLVAGAPVRFRLANLHVHDTHRANGTNQDHLVYLNCGTGGGVVEDCLLVGSLNGRAVKVGPEEPGGAAVANIVLRYNTMVDNTGPSNVQLAWDTSNVVVERNIMVHAARDRANVTSFSLTGRANVVRDNIGWRSAGVLEEATAGLADGGGNFSFDPRLRPSARLRPPNAALVPRNVTAARYGAG
ncbi:hypothetical protein [Kineococcus rubinsiae]|uniref:hypothetical protein n=1 Tax=Kineococcus rubinsiae TaxID=2609562 RepID=UPI00142FF295|nr:hypothetical protein [Kineococcus rubinsiae]NIZ92030.1 hypothetical protein [Kineococcus rubinsiae]